MLDESDEFEDVKYTSFKEEECESKEEFEMMSNFSEMRNISISEKRVELKYKEREEYRDD